RSDVKAHKQLYKSITPYHSFLVRFHHNRFEAGGLDRVVRAFQSVSGHAIKGQSAAESDRNGTSRSPVLYGRSPPAIFPRRSAQAERQARSRDFFQFPPGTLPDGRFPAKRQERRRAVRLPASPETLARP